MNMKKIIFLFLTLISLASYGQVYETNNIVRNNTLSPARVANALDVMKPYVASGTDTYAISPGMSIYAGGNTYTTGDIWIVTFTNANTGAATLNVNSDGAIDIRDNSGAALESGDLVAGGTYILRYNGTHFRIVGDKGSSGGGGGGGGAAQMLGEKVITASTYTAVAADTAYWVFFQNACTVTIPDDLPENFTATYQRLAGGGDVAFESDGTSVLEGIGIDFTLATDGAAVTIRKYDTDTYYLSGALGDLIETSDDLPEGSTNLYYTDARARAAAVANSITNGVTTSAPNQDQVYDALASLAVESLTTDGSVTTTGGTITLNFSSSVTLGSVTYTGVLSKQKIFVGAATFATAKDIALSNTTNAKVLNFHFEVTSISAVLTWPSEFLMQGNDDQWNPTTNEWIPPGTGKYEASATFDGTNWKLKISAAFI